MKNRTVKALAERVGQDRAEKFWALFVSALCGGIEPHDGDTFTREDITEAFANNIPARNALVAVLCGDASAAPKGRKFKIGKARSYTAADLATFIAADPRAEGLREEYMRRTGGIDALFYVDGKLAEEESADRIQRLFDRDPVASFVTIGGNDVEPVGYPEDSAKTDREDPYQPGAPLGQPGDVSARLGVSLDGILHETRQAIRCAVERDLSDASIRELQKDAAAAKGQAAIVYLANKPMAYRKWPTWPKPTLVLTRETQRPFSAAAEALGNLIGRDKPVTRKSSGPSIDEIAAAIISLGVDHRTCLAHVSRSFVATFPQCSSISAQVHSDLVEMSRADMLTDGTIPFRQYLTVAARLAAPVPQAKVFEAALTAMSAKALVPMLFVLTCGEAKWNSIRAQFAPAVHAGKLDVVADVDCPHGHLAQAWLAEQVGQATALLVLVNSTTMSSDVVASAVTTVRAAGKLAIPVMVRPCLTRHGPFAGNKFLLGGTEALSQNPRRQRRVYLPVCQPGRKHDFKLRTSSLEPVPIQESSVRLRTSTFLPYSCTMPWSRNPQLGRVAPGVANVRRPRLRRRRREHLFGPLNPLR